MQILSSRLMIFFQYRKDCPPFRKLHPLYPFFLWISTVIFQISIVFVLPLQFCLFSTIFNWNYYQ